MKHSIILFICLLIFSVVLVCGCGSSNDGANDTAPAAETAFSAESSPVYEPDEDSEGSSQSRLRSVVINEDLETEDAFVETEEVEDVIGTFQGLEDNHTAIFSFSGIEYTFYFEAEDVEAILYDAILGSSYTFSYRFDDSLNLNVIYEISEY